MSRPKLRLGVIGAGSWTVASHLPAFARHRDVVEFAIVNRRDPVLLETIRSQFGFAKASPSWEDVIAERPDIVLVASPAALHYEQTSAALEAGAHVLCEKPFTVASEDGWDLVVRSVAAGREIVVAFGWNYRPMVVEAARLMSDDDGLGEIEQLSMTMASATRELLATGGAYAEASPVAVPRPATWNDPNLSGGGYGQAQLSHALGLGLALTGLRGAEVFAYMSRPLAAPVELHDALAVRYTNGAIGTISGASNHRGAGGNKHQLEVRIIGARGQLLLDLEREALWRFRGDGDDVRVVVEPDAGRYDCDGPVDAIVELAMGRGVNRSPAELGARTVEVLEAAYRSAASGQREAIAVGGPAQR